MKRMNVIVDEKLLEEARKATGEKTYSATINRGLAELVRVERWRNGLRRLQELGEAAFDPDWLAQHDAKLRAQRKRLSADERRLSRKKVAPRGAR